MKRRRVLSACMSVAVAFALATGCGGDIKASSTSCPEGTETCPCYGNDTCDDGLTCASGFCVVASPEVDAGAGGSTGTGGGTTSGGGTGGTAAGGTGGVAGGTAGIAGVAGIAGAAGIAGDWPPENLTGTCYSGTPPGGQYCSCVWADCEGRSVDCICAPFCWEDRGDCLIVKPPGGGPTTSDEYIQTCESLTCEYVPGDDTGEFQEPDEMKCEGRNCGEPPQVEPPPERPPVVPPPLPPELPVCGVPVPGRTMLVEPVWGEFGIEFYVPFSAYAFATAQAWYSLGRAELGFNFSPSFYFALSLKEGYMGCSNDLDPWLSAYDQGILYRGQAQGVDMDGCFQIESTTHWAELCRMFDDEFDCVLGHAGLISSSNQDALGRDNFVSSAMITLYYNVWSFAFSVLRDGIPDMLAWLQTASDPYATEKLAAALFNRGSWGGAAGRIMNNCHQSLIEQCETGVHDHVRQVGAYTRELEAQVAAENCYDEMVSLADVDEYISQLLPLFDDKNEAAIRAAAHNGFLFASGGAETANFQQVALYVIDAVESNLPAKVHCPEDEVNQWYAPWGSPWTCPF